MAHGRAVGLFPVSSTADVQAICRKGTVIGYKNAADVLPEELLDQIRRYVEGEAIYIPKSEKRSKWGGGTGLRNEYDHRNEQIIKEWLNGATVKALAVRYCLCEDSIRKIVKKHKI